MTNRPIVIEKHEFELWMHNPITQALLTSLQNLREDICHALQDGSVIMDDKSGKLLPKLLGQREAIDLILNLKFEDFDINEEKV